MADPQLVIDASSLLDDVDARQVEFSAEVDGQRQHFAVLYDVLEALDGASPEQEPLAALLRHEAAVTRAAARALGRDVGQERVIVSENDLV